MCELSGVIPLARRSEGTVDSVAPQSGDSFDWLARGCVNLCGSMLLTFVRGDAYETEVSKNTGCWSASAAIASSDERFVTSKWRRTTQWVGSVRYCRNTGVASPASSSRASYKVGFSLHRNFQLLSFSDVADPSHLAVRRHGPHVAVTYDWHHWCRVRLSGYPPLHGEKSYEISGLVRVLAPS